MKKNIVKTLALLIMVTLVATSTTLASANIVVDLEGTWNWTFYLNGNPSSAYPHTMEIDSFNPATGDFSGTGFYNNLPITCLWDATGTVDSSGNIDFTIVYTGTYNTDYEVYVTGAINPDGSMSGSATTSAGQCGTWDATKDEEPIISLTFPTGSDAVVFVKTLDNGPTCIPPLPGDSVTPYIAVQLISGGFAGTVHVCVSYDGSSMTDEQEENLRLYMGDCVDFNQDGTINGEDLSLIKKGIKNDIDESPDPWLVSFDVNNDNTVDAADVDIVKEYMTKGIIINQGNNGEPQARLPWIDITLEVNINDDTICGETDHFSIFRGR